MFIKLHFVNSKEEKTPVLVNLDNVTNIYLSIKGGANIYFNCEDHFRAVETLEEIEQMVNK